MGKMQDCKLFRALVHTVLQYTTDFWYMRGHTVYCVRILPDTCTPFMTQCEMLWLITDQLVFFYCTWSSTSSWSQLWWTWDRNLFTASFSADSTSIWIVSRGIFRYSCRHIDLGSGSILWVHVCEQQYILVWLYCTWIRTRRVEELPCLSIRSHSTGYSRKNMEERRRQADRNIDEERHRERQKQTAAGIKIIVMPFLE